MELSSFATIVYTGRQLEWKALQSDGWGLRACSAGAAVSERFPARNGQMDMVPTSVQCSKSMTSSGQQPKFDAWLLRALLHQIKALPSMLCLTAPSLQLLGRLAANVFDPHHTRKGARAIVIWFAIMATTGTPKVSGFGGPNMILFSVCTVVKRIVRSNQLGPCLDMDWVQNQ